MKEDYPYGAERISVAGTLSDDNRGSNRPIKKEATLHRKAVTYLRSLGTHWVVEKRHGGAMGTAGLPDLNCCCCGLCCQLELKVGNNKPTPKQAHELRRYRIAGAVTMVARSMHDVEHFARVVESKCEQLGLKRTAT